MWFEFLDRYNAVTLFPERSWVASDTIQFQVVHLGAFQERSWVASDTIQFQVTHVVASGVGWGSKKNLGLPVTQSSFR
jgi:hypothetical protein